MKKKTIIMLSIVKVLSWIAFIGLCIKAGAILFTAILSAFNPAVSNDLYLGLDLSELYHFSQWQYAIMLSLLVFVSAIKAYIFYLVIQILMKLNVMQPFSKPISILIERISYLALIAGIFSHLGADYTAKRIDKGIGIHDLGQYWEGSDEFLFLAAVIFIIAQVFNRGMEIQSENELTI